MHFFLEDFLQAHLPKIYDKMQSCNKNSSSRITTTNNNVTTTSNISGNSSNKRCPQKYTGNTLAVNSNMLAYQQQATAGGKNSTRKSRHNNNKQNHQQQQQQQQQQFDHIHKRNGTAGGTGSECSPAAPTSNWLQRGYGRQFVHSSCIEDKLLGHHNPGHRNSTSSDATSEDIDSSSELPNKSKGNSCAGSIHASGGSKSRSKRHQKQSGQQTRNPDHNGQRTGAATPCTNQKAKQGNAKWRQQQPNPSSNNQQQQMQQQKRGRNKKPGKWSNNIIDNPNSNHGGSSQQKTCDSSSSSALSSPTSSATTSATSSPTNSPTSYPRANGNRKRIEAALEWRREQELGRQNANFLVPPLRQYEQLEFDDKTVVQQLRRHIIDNHLLRVYGFPVDSVVHEGAIEIFKCMPHMSFAAALAETAQAVTVINYHDGLTNRAEEEVANSTDSGNSSPQSLDSESGGEWSGSECESSNSSSSSAGEAALGLELKYCHFVPVERSLSKPCARCKRHFLVDELTGQYLTHEECQYHSGKYQRYYDGVSHGRWTCCNEGEESSPGCCLGDRHVWSGSVVGVNGPYYDFVRTEHRGSGEDEPAVYALDCEMSYTGRGLDVTKVSLVALNGQLVYEHFVRPVCDIIDYNTQYSGITETDLCSGAKSLAEVQRDLLQLITADTILIGHGLENDLRALRLVHNTLIDTSISFPHCNGFPYRRALRHLTKVHLKRDIQAGDGTTGHSSFEDSRACMELMLWRVNRELDPAWSWDD
uniref:SD04906p n=1 Tax=Drosophila melanogaster TaxID=7227 RepID=Q960E5_DROME|nr:SD04906p [Drosophila melanogaster]